MICIKFRNYLHCISQDNEFDTRKCEMENPLYIKGFRISVVT